MFFTWLGFFIRVLDIFYMLYVMQWTIKHNPKHILYNIIKYITKTLIRRLAIVSGKVLGLFILELLYYELFIRVILYY